MKNILRVLILFYTTILISQTPHLEGTINLDIDQGLVHCVFKFSKIDKNGSYSVLLNRGFNVKYFKLNNQVLDAARKPSYNSIDYDIYKTNSSDSDLPLTSVENIEVEYSGAFPVFKDTENNDGDDMGNIAIKNNIIRATVQSNFIPELKDRISNKRITVFTYKIIINSSKKTTVYLNGCEPQSGKKLIFENNKPLDFLIYAGNYKVKQYGNLYLLNSNLDDKYVAILAENVKKISDFYSKSMGIGYDDKVVFPQIFSVGPSKQYRKWAFTVTPTIVMDVNELSSKIDLNSRTITDVNTFRIIAHEMAHKYFMQQLNAVGTKNLWRFYHEALAQYLAFKAVEELVSKKAYRETLDEFTFTNDNKAATFKTFDEIENSEIDLTRASYDYYPLYLIGFEKMFGIDKTFQLLQKLVKDNDAFTFDTEYFKTRARETANSAQDFLVYEQTFLDSKNCINQFNQK
jgi:hypothetical protein